MARDHWRDILNRKQTELQPLICGCLLGILLLTAVRDYFLVEERLSTWWYSYYLAGFVVLTTVLFLSLRGKIAIRHIQLLASICALFIVLNPAVVVLAGFSIGLLYAAVAIMGCALAVLSIPHLVAIQAIGIGCWLLATQLTSFEAPLVPSLVLDVIAAGLGITILRQRIAVLEKIYRLEIRVEALESILPMCARCKKTRDESGNWFSVESYLEERNENLTVTHGICPDCKQELYGDVLNKQGA